MKNNKWGPRDVKALRRLVDKYRTNQATANAIGTCGASIGRWLAGASPRYVDTLRVILEDHGCYQVRGRAK
jgi:hypothetical protein